MDDDQAVPERGPLPDCLTQGLTAEAPATLTPEGMTAQIMQALGGGPLLASEESDEPEDLRQALDLLAALGVERVEFQLEGGGDEGTATTSQVSYRDGREETEIPTLPVGLTDNGRVLDVAEILEEHAGEAPDFNWVDNEGGSGTVAYLPLEPVGERVEVDMHYHDDDDEEYDEDDGDDEDELDIDGDEDGDDAVIIGGDE